jgi:hypothetical protein
MENLTADEIRLRDEWRAGMLKADWVQEAIDAAILADRKACGGYLLSMIEPEWPDHLQPRLIVKSLARGKQLAEKAADKALVWSHSMGPVTSTWRSTADKTGCKYVVTRVPVES